MSDSLPDITDADRAAILLECWWSHDGQWFLKTAAAHGLADAMERNEDTIESIGRIEMKKLHTAMGAPAVAGAADFLKMHQAAQQLIGWPASAARLDGDGFIVEIDDCVVWQMTEAAGLTDVAPGCRGALRRQKGWASVFFSAERFSWTREFGLPDGDSRCGYRFSLEPD
jgi:hypothetical protein